MVSKLWEAGVSITGFFLELGRRPEPGLGPPDLGPPSVPLRDLPLLSFLVLAIPLSSPFVSKVCKIEFIFGEILD
jgi:hypothetical protein